MALSLFLPNHPTTRDYEIREKIGQGGMGAVYKGMHRETGQEVAIKIIDAELTEDDTQLQRFEQEYRVASKLIHPNMVRMLDFGRDETTVYLVMEYVPGQSLCRKVERGGPMPEGAAVLLISQVAQALDYAHKHLIIHRDVKPDNILVTEDGRAKLTDFGLVKDIIGDRHLTEPMSTLGTSQYMAPEQWHDAKHVDPRCDIYSLAATLYVAVTGKLPFASCRTPTAVIQQLLGGGLKPPREHVPALSEEVDEAIRRAMNPDPAKRPATCLAFIKSMTKKKRRSLETESAPVRSRGMERRAFVRYPLDLGTSCAVETSVHSMPQEDKECWPAIIQDISQQGFALVLGRRIEIGASVVVDLEPPYFQSARSLQARIANVQVHGSGHWRLGCVFAEALGQEELQALL